MERTKQPRSSTIALGNGGRNVLTYNPKHILCCDPSFTAFGYAVMTLDGKVKDCGVIKTAPDQKKMRIRKSDTTLRRISEINQVLLQLVREYNVCYICIEACHGSQNASAAVMVGATTGLLQMLSDALNIPLDSFSEGESKKALLGKISASKKETIDAIAKLYDVPWTKAGFRNEAIADAISIYHAATKLSNTMKMLKQ